MIHASTQVFLNLLADVLHDVVGRADLHR